ncbi:hypothetical protein B0H14DRAFT_820187 [Mycena olivaceomarginata]|nr:hypothetical protein B0H14DRAFT_820187 [Mycena olivaceomarginata]
MLFWKCILFLCHQSLPCSLSLPLLVSRKCRVCYFLVVTSPGLAHFPPFSLSQLYCVSFSSVTGPFLPHFPSPSHLQAPYQSIWDHGLLQTWDSNQSSQPVALSH